MEPKYTLEDCLDLHDWSDEERVCGLKNYPAHSHGMRCKACGIRRHGPYDEQGAYHYFTYDHPDRPHELIPPCAAVRMPRKAVLIEFQVCQHCGHLCEAGACQHGCAIGVRTLKAFCRRKT